MKLLPFPKLKTAPILVFIAVALFTISPTKACTPLGIPSLVTQTIIGNVLYLDFQNNTNWLCNGYQLQVEIVCDNNSFTGLAANIYTGTTMNMTVNPQPYPTLTLSLASFCPGTTYKIRARDTYPQFFLLALGHKRILLQQRVCLFSPYLIFLPLLTLFAHPSLLHFSPMLPQVVATLLNSRIRGFQPPPSATLLSLRLLLRRAVTSPTPVWFREALLGVGQFLVLFR